MLTVQASAEALAEVPSVRENPEHDSPGERRRRVEGLSEDDRHSLEDDVRDASATDGRDRRECDDAER